MTDITIQPFKAPPRGQCVWCKKTAVCTHYMTFYDAVHRKNVTKLYCISCMLALSKTIEEAKKHGKVDMGDDKVRSDASMARSPIESQVPQTSAQASVPCQGDDIRQA